MRWSLILKTKYEQKFTSTTSKLLQNLDRLQEMRQGKFRPISIQLAPTDKCNLNCVFCSVKEREMKELSFEECKQTLNSFKKLGAKTVEITGGGDPTIYPYINELIAYAGELNYQIGMISNGAVLKKNVAEESLEKLTWLRISLNSLDYVKEIDLSIPDNITLGFSYVWNDYSSIEKLNLVKQYQEKYRAKYVRIVPDCLDVHKKEQYINDIQPLIDKYPNFFFQQKEHLVPHRCWMGYIKPFVNSDGYIYHCSANPLLSRKFNDKFRLGHITEIEKIWESPAAFNTCDCVEGKCFFKEHNDLIEQVLLNIDHKDFI